MAKSTYVRATKRNIESELVVSSMNGSEVWEVPTDAQTRYLSHDYFRYIGKFPPQIAHKFLLDYSKKGNRVLDPMCGGGTVLIESRLLGRRSIGIDVNPVSILVSSVVSDCIQEDILSENVGMFLDELDSATGSQTLLPLKPGQRKTTKKRRPLDLKGHEEYFDKATIEAFELFFQLLKSLPDKKSQDFILVALLSILRSISHANVKKMNLEFDMDKRTRKPFLRTLTSKLDQMMRINSELCHVFKSTAPEVKLGKAQQTDLEDESIDLVVVHPPYMSNTAFSEATELQLAVLGISHRDIWRRELRARGSFLHEPNGVRKYIVGWNKILGEIHRVLRSGRYCTAVVGDGQFDYTRIPVGVITIELAQDIGFRLVKKARHRLNHNTGRTQSRKMRDQHVLVFQK